MTEGDVVTLPEAVFLYPSDPEDLSLTVNWGDGTMEDGILVAGVGGGTIANTHQYGDDGIFRVTLTLTDNAGTSVTDDATVTVVNASPVVVFVGPSSSLVGESVSFAFTATDPSRVDQATGFTYAIDWNGDGTVDKTVSGPSPLTVEHAFDDPGLTTVTVTATDKDGGRSGLAVHTINVIQPVNIDVKPGSNTNPINLNANGVIPITVFTTDDFKASWIDMTRFDSQGRARQVRFRGHRRRRGSGSDLALPSARDEPA